MERCADEVLWTQAQQGDARSFGDLFDRHCDSVLNYCAFKLGTYQDAEDLTSQVFLEAWRCRHRLTVQGATAVPLLFGIAAHVCAHQQRKLGRATRAVQRLPRPTGLEDDQADVVANRVDAQRDAAVVRRAIDDLAVDQRMVVELCLIGGLDTHAASVALNVPEGTVKSRLSRARRRLLTTLTAGAETLSKEYR